MQALPATTALATPAPPVATCTPRRPNVPLRVREWILAKVNHFQYHDKGLRTKEEKQAFIIELSRKLNERFSSETGTWDEARTGTFVRNLKNKTSAAQVAPPSLPTATFAAQVTSPMEQLLMDWQVVLQTSSRLNSQNLARHPSDRGSCNEDLIKGFLASVLSTSRYIGVGSGEMFYTTLTKEKKKTRQLDIVLYNPDYPCLRPARFRDSSDGCCCFYEESVMVVIEVKTTLTNQDLSDVGLAASTLPKHIPLLILSFDSQSTLSSIDTSSLPENVKGIFTLSHGSLVRGVSSTESDWRSVHPSQRTPLIEFYVAILRQLLEYALQQQEREANCSAFIFVLETLLQQVTTEEVVTIADCPAKDNDVLREIDVNIE